MGENILVPNSIKLEKEEDKEVLKLLEQVPDEIHYMFMKYRVLLAKINKDIGMNIHARDICN